MVLPLPSREFELRPASPHSIYVYDGVYFMQLRFTPFLCQCNLTPRFLTPLQSNPTAHRPAVSRKFKLRPASSECRGISVTAFGSSDSVDRRSPEKAEVNSGLNTGSMGGISLSSLPLECKSYRKTLTGIFKVLNIYTILPPAGLRFWVKLSGVGQVQEFIIIVNRLWGDQALSESRDSDSSLDRARDSDFKPRVLKQAVRYNFTGTIPRRPPLSALSACTTEQPGGTILVQEIKKPHVCANGGLVTAGLKQPTSARSRHTAAYRSSILNHPTVHGSSLCDRRPECRDAETGKMSTETFKAWRRKLSQNSQWILFELESDNAPCSKSRLNHIIIPANFCKPPQAKASMSESIA
ncbi:hypothetical protein C8F04DRAFT_1232968 [Mycena alexandri]|uniref:Uncharacterized protein n=1 Tax=Mycena alexandri TaxID=1745969 RepID=A0AAD6X6J5_9AGAR|nr:hypothetical protein C8F04DRAFT_1232968 [Mycena alexandri]